MTSSSTLKQMSKPTATVVKILEENWTRIRESCRHFEEDKNCPITEGPCAFSKCPVLKEAEDVEGVEESEQSAV